MVTFPVNPEFHCCPEKLKVLSVMSTLVFLLNCAAMFEMYLYSESCHIVEVSLFQDACLPILDGLNIIFRKKEREAASFVDFT